MLSSCIFTVLHAYSHPPTKMPRRRFSFVSHIHPTSPSPRQFLAHNMTALAEMRRNALRQILPIPNEPLRFADLPFELRTKILEYAAPHIDPTFYRVLSPSIKRESMLLVSKRVNQEANGAWYFHRTRVVKIGALTNYTGEFCASESCCGISHRDGPVSCIKKVKLNGAVLALPTPSHIPLKAFMLSRKYVVEIDLRGAGDLSMSILSRVHALASILSTHKAIHKLAIEVTVAEDNFKARGSGIVTDVKEVLCPFLSLVRRVHRAEVILDGYDDEDEIDGQISWGRVLEVREYMENVASVLMSNKRRTMI